MTSDAASHPHAGPPGSRRGARRAFFAAMLRKPGQVGAVAPTSGTMATLLASVVPATGTPVVVELGPGTGAVTTAIDNRLPRGGRHLAVELDTKMAGYLRRAHPGLEVVEGDAVKLSTLLAERGVERADTVVSGLPWALFDAATQDSIVQQIAETIGPDGAFTTFAYRHGMALAAARRFRRTLHSTFHEVVLTPTVWRNVPPAFTYICRHPRALTA